MASDQGSERFSLSKEALRQLSHDSAETRHIAHTVSAPDIRSGMLPPDPDLEIVFPVGHFAGPMYTGVDATVPASFEVRFRDGVFSLSAEEYAVWAVAHGDPNQVGRRPTTRTIIEQAASGAGVENTGTVFDSLIKDGLLTITTVGGELAKNFARCHQMRPLALGLGNSPANPAEFQIGLPNAARVSVGYDTYHMWLFVHRHESLWEAITTIATEATKANDEYDGDDNVRLEDDPAVLLRILLTALPVLISTSSVYLDRV